MSDFRLPDLGEGLQEAEIVSWQVAPGQDVVAGQTLLSVETDKAVVDIPAPRGGRIAAIHGTAGDRIPVGAVLVEFAEDRAEDRGALVGRLPGPADISPPRQAARPAPADERENSGERTRALPAVRALAKRLGVELASVAPSGPDGQVTAGDVERAAALAASAGCPAQEFDGIRSVRRAMAANMTRAHASVVPATVLDDADVQGWRREDADMSARLIRAVCKGCAAVPALNAWYDPQTGRRTLHDRVDLGIATDTADGLFVPVLRDAGRLTPQQIRARLDDLKAAVAERRVPAGDLRGQTISLSNFGTFGGRFAALVVIPPQVAILGAGRVYRGIAPRSEDAVPHRLLPLSLTFDHRVVTGGEAARFLAAVIADLEQES